MSGSLRDSLLFCVRTFNNKYAPFSQSAQRNQVISAVLDIAINSLFLKFRDAFFTEYFYKLRRIETKDTLSSALLPNKTKVILMVCYIIRNHLVKAVRKWSTQNLKNRRSKLKSLLAKLFFYGLHLYDITQFWFKIK